MIREQSSQHIVLRPECIDGVRIGELSVHFLQVAAESVRYPGLFGGLQSLYNTKVVSRVVCTLYK